MKSNYINILFHSPKSLNKLTFFSDMSHRKVYSQGSIPFSWEDTPGVCKVTHQGCPINTRLNALQLTSSPSTPTPCNPDRAKPVSTNGLKIPLPPCPPQLPRRSASAKGYQWQEDPFLVAYKECTKNVESGKHSSRESKKGIGSKLRKSSKSIFSCKSTSCDVSEDSILKLSQLPALPRYNIARVQHGIGD